MRTKIIEATERTRTNWGKFLVARFDDEWSRRSEIDPDDPVLKRVPLLRAISVQPEHILVLDLQTREGAMFLPLHAADAEADLNGHRIWVCPMYEPFLKWLYQQDLSDLDQLPNLVDLGDVPPEFRGYRRPGPPPEEQP